MVPAGLNLKRKSEGFRAEKPRHVFRILMCFHADLRTSGRAFPPREKEVGKLRVFSRRSEVKGRSFLHPSRSQEAPDLPSANGLDGTL